MSATPGSESTDTASGFTLKEISTAEFRSLYPLLRQAIARYGFDSVVSWSTELSTVVPTFGIGAKNQGLTSAQCEVACDEIERALSHRAVRAMFDIMNTMAGCAPDESAGIVRAIVGDEPMTDAIRQREETIIQTVRTFICVVA